MALCHLIIGIIIGTLFLYPLAQTIIILSILLVLFGITVVLRPWVYGIFTILELLAQLLIILAVIILLILAAYQHKNCLVCGDREGVLCWIIVIALFLAIVLPLLGLIFQTIISLINRDKYATE